MEILKRASALTADDLGRKVGFAYAGGYYELPLLGLRQSFVLPRVDPILAAVEEPWLLVDLGGSEGLQWLDLPRDSVVSIFRRN